MNIFKNYADYYDLLYQDKNYEHEVEYIDSLIKKYSKDAKSILELGCGTGKHAICLVDKEYDVTGVDLSSKMIQEARDRVVSKNVDFYVDDIREFNLGKRFDVILSLFHVISYLTTNEDLIKVFSNVDKHLKNNGLFLFDCWYGPSVLTLKPSVKVKRFENDKFSLTRIAQPKQNFNDNLVDVNYQIYVQNKSDNKISEFKEAHRMRYLFKPEIEMLLEKSNLELIHFEEWLTGKKAGSNTWGVCFVCRRGR